MKAPFFGEDIKASTRAVEASALAFEPPPVDSFGRLLGLRSGLRAYRLPVAEAFLLPAEAF